MANTISRMERDGLFERRPHPEDGRARLIYITDRARSLETAATKIHSDHAENYYQQDRYD